MSPGQDKCFLGRGVLCVNLPHCFRSDISAVSVTIAGSECILSSVAATEIQCVTEERKPSTKALVEVSVGQQGIATQVGNVCDFALDHKGGGSNVRVVHIRWFSTLL